MSVLKCSSPEVTRIPSAYSSLARTSYMSPTNPQGVGSGLLHLHTTAGWGSASVSKTKLSQIPSASLSLVRTPMVTLSHPRNLGETL